MKTPLHSSTGIPSNRKNALDNSLSGCLTLMARRIVHHGNQEGKQEGNEEISQESSEEEYEEGRQEEHDTEERGEEGN
jgi:hypothetical protein